MAYDKPVSVPQKRIGSVDINGFAGGLFLNGEQNGKGNQIVESNNVEISIDGYLQNRKSLQPWLPNTNNTVYEIFPALWQGTLYYFTIDGTKARWTTEGATSWTDCGGSNTLLTAALNKPRFVRVANVLLVLNGGAGDKLMYIDLATKNVVKYTFVADPVVAPTASPTVLLNSGSYVIYYGYTFTSATGETKISPILQYTINKPRSQWKSDGTEYLTISRPAGNPAGAKYWNLYIALSANGGVIQSSDMLRLASGLDLNTTAIVDNGSLAIDLGLGNPPAANSTDGARVRFGIETNGRPVLWGDVDTPENIWIGGDQDYALDFSSSNGGFRSTPSVGTNYYPASVIGFRNGQGVPSLTILFSNTQGLSKQATLEQRTINYGTQSFVVWAVTEQNYGAAGVASTYGVINYKGQLSFPSTDGFMSMDTQPQLQNVLATKGIDRDIKPYVRQIKVSALTEIVGTGWNDQLLWVVPPYGFDTPQEILIRDLNNNGAWITLQIPAQWIGTVSPPNAPAFVYICQGNKIYKLFSTFGTVDYGSGGAVSNFTTSAKGTLMGINDAHNASQAVVQAMFYLREFLGTIILGVNYRDQFGKMKTRTRTVVGNQYVLSSAGGWSDPHYTYGAMKMLGTGGWSAVAPIDTTSALPNKEVRREPVKIGRLASELQWFVQTPIGYNSWQLKSVSYEGENLGVKPDLR